MAVSNLELVLWTLSDIRARHLRLRGAYQILHRTAEPGERVFLASAQEEPLTKLQEFEKDVTDAFEKIEELSRGKSWPPAAVSLLSQTARRGYLAFDLTQVSLFPYLPLAPRPPADTGSFLARALGLSPTRKSHRERFALTYGRYSNWDSRAFPIGPRTVAVIPVPFVDTLTPLRWPLLVHELAHWSPPGGKGVTTELLAEAMRKQLNLSADEEIPADVSRAVEELYADRVAFQACGMAYAYALAVEGARDDAAAHIAREGVPSLHQRLHRLGGQAADLAESLPTLWRGSDVEFDVREWRALDQAIGGLAPTATRVDDEIVQVAKGRLKAGRPSPSVCTQPPLTATQESLILQGLPPAPAGLSRKQKRDYDAPILALFNSALDQPCSDAEILVAAWEAEFDERVEDRIGALKKPISLGLGPKDRGERIADESPPLFQRDTALRHSLQVAAVHRWFLEWDQKLSEAEANR